MRALRRWLRRRRGELRLGVRREEVRKLLSEHFGRQCLLTPAGTRGRDSIYLVSDVERVFACLRIVNPHRQRRLRQIPVHLDR